ncbi:hypothetical protein HCA84_02415 [Listeria booriae]|uniref:hypothetical protein n=1 Tax=Listeria booriae TaxID=1552123 RepID=UPI001625C1EC|nr:hypothetical protein [Listeria booriae]MBC1893113.1 hypothetical protein [Listeria booriae]MBC1974518.1 hypothetical protein [Listeria booriae]MBC2031809.1 hypothetical protein [Listeria booriae]
MRLQKNDWVKDLVEKQCVDFICIRDDKELFNVKAFFADENIIQTAPGYDVKERDWLKHIDSKNAYFVDKLSPLAGPEGTDGGATIRYLTEHQIQQQKEKSRSAISINTINGGAVIGDFNSVTFNNGYGLDTVKELITSKPETDQAELDKLVTAVEMLIDANMPVSKGSLSKFSDLLAKHSDIAIAISSTLGSWIFGK